VYPYEVCVDLWMTAWRSLNLIARFVKRSSFEYFPVAVKRWILFGSVLVWILTMTSAFLTETVSNFPHSLAASGGTRWRSFLRHCGTNRKVAGSIPDFVI